MVDRDQEDRRLTGLLRSVRAEPDPVIWTRVRARIEAGEKVSGFLGWLMRPAALASSMAALVASVALSAVLVLNTEPRMAASESNLSDALLAMPSTPLEELSIPSNGAEDTL